ncbi:TIR domain-containing protein [Actinosynnema sp. NPDC091369]
MLLGEEHGVAPADADRFRRFARSWLDNEKRQLRSRIEDSETYRLWAATAGSGQTLEPAVIAGILADQGEDEDTAAVVAVLVARDEQARTMVYDIAVSFASEQRDYVERTVSAAKALGLAVFYDRDMTHAWWGRNFVIEQRRVYGQRTLHFVPFLSTEYLAGQYPRDEFSYAMLAAVRRGDDYVLPVLVGDVVVPEEVLHPHIAYLRAEDVTPDELAIHMKAKVDYSRAHGRSPRDFGTIVTDVLDLGRH